MATTWTVSLWCAGRDSGIRATARTRKAAWLAAKQLAGAPYLTGVSAATGERFGPDLTNELEGCFAHIITTVMRGRQCFMEVSDTLNRVRVRLERHNEKEAK